MDWLLLRGLAREGAHWGDFPQRLASEAPADRVHVADLPGMGHLRHFSCPGSIPAIRSQLKGHLPQLEAPYLVVGLSLGGMVACDLAFAAPQQLAGAVVINSSCAWSPPWQRFKPGNWPNFIKLLCSRDIDRREAMILSLTSNCDVSEAHLAAWQRVQRLRPVSRRNVVRQMLAASRYSPPKRRLEVPSLVLSSLGDRLVSHHCSRRLASVLNADLREHDWAGHDLPMDDPEWVLGQLLEFRATLAD